MFSNKLLLFSILTFCAIVRLTYCEEISNKTFPDYFKFGAGSSAYQVEGGWDNDGKGENIIDYMSHNYPEVMNHSSGDVACDSYHKYEDDIRIAKATGLDFYRFSLSWSRLLPTGLKYQVNQPGVDYYNKLIDGLLEVGIEPVVTLLHFDVPKSLDWMGSMFNPDFSGYFEDYADVAFSLFGDRVKTWFTINEPASLCRYEFPPTAQIFNAMPKGVIEYQCARGLLLAHATAYHLYDTKYREEQQGRVSISLNAKWYEPYDNSIANIAAQERALQFDLGWFASPIILGDYPPIMKYRVNKHSSELDMSSRLPDFTLKELVYIKGTYDFLGLNHYTSRLVKNSDFNFNGPSIEIDRGVEYIIDPNWETSDYADYPVYPVGLRKILAWIKRTYGDIEIFITENGYAGPDDKRILYHKRYMSNMLEAIYEDEVNVTAYSLWSLMDSYEWYTGYGRRFGIYEVNFDSNNKTRKPKSSAQFYRRIIETRCLDK